MKSIVCWIIILTLAYAIAKILYYLIFIEKL